MATSSLPAVVPTRALLRTPIITLRSPMRSHALILHSDVIHSIACPQLALRLLAKKTRAIRCHDMGNKQLFAFSP